ncbi:MAG: hypothetical protein JW807_02010 [Spirochaetes bacterium]|nr:hypothetical protein [Spirochaetota bacterium]
MLNIYILSIGILLVFVGSVEAGLPLRAFAFWKAWVSQKAFFLHGIALIAGGFPLTLYNGPISPFIFIIGLFAVLTGPFVLLYPDKIRAMFQSVAGEMKDDGIKKIVRVEAFLRIAAGTVCVASFMLK